MNISIKFINENFSVASQIKPDDISMIASMGYKSIIINRPDFEDNILNQPTSSSIIQTAQNIGLQIEYQPVIANSIKNSDVIVFAKLLKVLPKPILAYCRTGTRCIQLFNKFKLSFNI